MFKLARNIIIIVIAGFLIINCDRILPDINTGKGASGLEKTAASVFNGTKHVIGKNASDMWKKAEPKLKDYGKQTVKNTEKVVNEKTGF